MTKALIDIDSDLWSIARRYAGARDWTVNELITTALENLVLPIAGRQIEEPVTVRVDVTPVQTMASTMPVEKIERRTAPPGFGRSYPAPKPVRKTR